MSKDRRGQWGWSIFIILQLVGTAVSARQMPIVLRAVPMTNMVVIDEPIPVLIEMTNSSAFGWEFSWQSASGENCSGFVIEMSNLVGRTQPKVVGSFVGQSYAATIGPHEMLFEEVNLAEVFSIQEPGRYRILVRYQEFATFSTSDENNRMTKQTRRLREFQSEPIEVIVELPDPEMVGKIESLLQSGRDADVERGLRLLADARIGVYRRVIPSLWSVIQKGSTSVKKSAMKLFLKRIEVGCDRVAEKALLSELSLASVGSVGGDSSLRLAIAESLPRLMISGGGRLVHEFFSTTVPDWFDVEPSAACRVALARVLPINGKRAAAIVQRDEDPQVRVAIIQRLMSLGTSDFLDAADLFSKLGGNVTIDGRSVPLAVFVADEKKRLMRIPGKKSEP